jgi:hypothetical protein
MFNDLNNPNNQGRPAVDDIFAETDKPSMGVPQSDIETHRVGLAATGETLPPMEMEHTSGGSKKILKLVIIFVIIIAALGTGYFVYSQFFKAQDNNVLLTATTTPKAETPKTENNKPETTTSEAKTGDANFVAVIPGVATGTQTINPIVIASSSLVGTTTVVETPAESLVDSDSDGLTDAEEKKAGTNINVIDTDNDGLSDYDEVKIYHTDPLSADTDGDTYLDGAEVKSGYNPNGPGKLPGNQPK